MAGSYEDYKTYLNDLYKDVLKKTATVNYDTRSPGQLKAMLEGYLKPGLDKNIAAREQQGRANAASIDSDAAARGMGGSTWLTDMKNRQNNAVASDIAGMRNDYNSNLFNSLLSKLSEQDSRKISVDEYNATQKNKALDRAFAAANQNINSWAKAAGGGGGGSKTVPDATQPVTLGALLRQQQDINQYKKDTYNANQRAKNKPVYGGGGRVFATTR